MTGVVPGALVRVRSGPNRGTVGYVTNCAEATDVPGRERLFYCVVLPRDGGGATAARARDLDPVGPDPEGGE